MIKSSTIEIKILTILLKSSKGLDAFSLFRRLEASFSDFSKTIRSLCEKKLIKEDMDDFFIITEEGIKKLTQNNISKKEKPWRNVPDKFLTKKTSTSEFYVPSIRLLDKKTFNKH